MSATVTKSARTRISPRKATQQVANLHEDFVPGSATRVDRDTGVIHGVKVLGRHSKNSHQIPGADQTTYTLEAMHKASKLYEGLAVNVDHPSRKDPVGDRSSRDRIGWLENVQVKDDGIYADLHLLKSDSLTDKLFEAAERNPRLFGLSHNATGQWTLEGDTAVIVEIRSVRSVDIVADGGSVSSLFESQRNQVKPASHAAAGRARSSAHPLFENEKEGYPMPEDMAMDSGATPAADGRSLLAQALAALAASGDMSDHELAGKIHKLMKPEEAAPEPAAETKEMDEEPAKEEKKEDDMKESLKTTETKAPEVVRLTESKAKSLCSLAGVNADAQLVEAMCECSEDRAYKLLEWAKQRQPVSGHNRVAARSAPAGSNPIKLPETVNGLLEVLRGR